MKKLSSSLLLLAFLLSALLLLVSCEVHVPSDETQAESSNVTSTVEDTQPNTNPQTDETAETDAEPQVPASQELSEEEALKCFNDAYTAYLNEKNIKNVMDMHMSMIGENMSNIKMTTVQNGDNFVFIQESDGVVSKTVILSDKVYLENSIEGMTELAVISVDAAQREWILAQTLSSGMDITDSPDQYEDVTGLKLADGTVVLNVASVSDEFESSLTGAFAEEGANATLTLNNMEFTVSADGRLSHITLDMVISTSFEGYDLLFTFEIKADVSFDYEDVTVAAPENAADYIESSFDVCFGFAPDAEEAAAAGLPLDKDSYTIGAEGSDFSADDQYMVLAFYPSAYEGKTFTIYGIVGEDEELGASVINAGDFGIFYFYCPAGVSAPVFGDTVKMTATFENTVDKGYSSDYFCYTMMVSDCEVLSHGVGPNGGRIMFITASTLNVRTSSDTSSSENILGTLSKGDAVEVFDQDEKGWWRIEFNGQTAYISNKYVSETRP